MSPAIVSSIDLCELFYYKMVIKLLKFSFFRIYCICNKVLLYYDLALTGLLFHTFLFLILHVKNIPHQSIARLKRTIAALAPNVSLRLPCQLYYMFYKNGHQLQKG